ncbi:MAG: hypothetical protein FRX49_00621 [Trebouxia sp. A1-2]|nr:MAG: hypothetical protein FRX49_00621 [Trebouxia sp. A1-2]
MRTPSAARASRTAAFSSSGSTCIPVWYQLPCPVTGLNTGAVPGRPRGADPTVADTLPLGVRARAADDTSGTPVAAGLAAAAEELACRGKEWENDDSRLEAENSSWISATELAVEGARKLGTVPAIDYTHRQSHTGFDRASDSRQHDDLKLSVNQSLMLRDGKGDL